MASDNEPVGRKQLDEDDRVREIIAELLLFVAGAKAPHADKHQAIDNINALRARLLP